MKIIITKELEALNESLGAVRDCSQWLQGHRKSHVCCFLQKTSDEIERKMHEEFVLDNGFDCPTCDLGVHIENSKAKGGAA